MSTPIELQIDKVVTPNQTPSGLRTGEVWCTHSGVLDIGGIKLRCHILSNGMRIFDAKDIEKFFGKELVVQSGNTKQMDDYEFNLHRHWKDEPKEDSDDYGGAIKHFQD